MGLIIIFSEIFAFTSLFLFAKILDGRYGEHKPIHLLNYGIWPLLAFGLITAVIFIKAGERLSYMPHIMWHILLISLICTAGSGFMQLRLRCVKQRKLAVLFLGAAICGETLSVAMNIVKLLS